MQFEKRQLRHRTRPFRGRRCAAEIVSTLSRLAGRASQDGDGGTEERLGANLEQLRREVARLSRAQQALFAYLDTLGKTILTCIPEPPNDARPQAVARAKERYDRMLKSVAKAMAGDAQTAIQDLAAHVE